jgi:hypothetical protein
VYFHADRRDVVYRIYRLLDNQKQDLLQFMLSDPSRMPPPECPLPILPSDDNQQRVDPESPIETTGIFRDPWERPPRLYPRRADPRLKDVMDYLNYISHAEQREARTRARREFRERFDREKQERREEEQQEIEEGEH